MTDRSMKTWRCGHRKTVANTTPRGYCRRCQRTEHTDIQEAK